MDIQLNSLEDLKKYIKKYYGSIYSFCIKHNINYQRMSDLLNYRYRYAPLIKKTIKELNLSEEEIAKIFPSYYKKLKKTS